MSEAIISRRGIIGEKIKYVTKTEVFVENSMFIVPNAKNNSFSVMIFGGGGGGSWGGGGGGWMNNGIFELSEGDIIPITIGAGGISNDSTAGTGGSSGGTSSFGKYLSANGGGASVHISSYIGGNGGSGGSGGGGMGGVLENNANFAKGGDGYQFGGGGPGGNGGPWGGGGAGAIGAMMPSSNSSDYFSSWQRTMPGGKGGIYGGDGTDLGNGNNGINTLNYAEIPSSLQGDGIYGIGMNYNTNSYVLSGDTGRRLANLRSGGAGGGYGGRGGNSAINNYFSSSGMGSSGAGYVIQCGLPVGGGGGYGGNGGSYKVTVPPSNTSWRGIVFVCSGGGGGYGGDGGNASIVSSNSSYFMSVAGRGGGGGGYGCGAESDGVGNTKSAGYGGGGSGNVPGGSGICIVQYYTKE